MNTFKVLVNNLFKEIFYGKIKKKNVLIAFFIFHKIVYNFF